MIDRLYRGEWIFGGLLRYAWQLHNRLWTSSVTDYRQDLVAFRPVFRRHQSGDRTGQMSQFIADRGLHPLMARFWQTVFRDDLVELIRAESEEFPEEEEDEEVQDPAIDTVRGRSFPLPDTHEFVNDYERYLYSGGELPPDLRAGCRRHRRLYESSALYRADYDAAAALVAAEVDRDIPLSDGTVSSDGRPLTVLQPGLPRHIIDSEMLDFTAARGLHPSVAHFWAQNARQDLWHQQTLHDEPAFARWLEEDPDFNRLQAPHLSGDGDLPTYGDELRDRPGYSESDRIVHLASTTAIQQIRRQLGRYSGPFRTWLTETGQTVMERYNPYPPDLFTGDTSTAHQTRQQQQEQQQRVEYALLLGQTGGGTPLEHFKQHNGSPLGTVSNDIPAGHLARQFAQDRGLPPTYTQAMEEHDTRTSPPPPSPPPSLPPAAAHARDISLDTIRAVFQSMDHEELSHYQTQASTIINAEYHAMGTNLGDVESEARTERLEQRQRIQYALFLDAASPQPLHAARVLARTYASTDTDTDTDTDEKSYEATGTAPSTDGTVVSTGDAREFFQNWIETRTIAIPGRPAPPRPLPTRASPHPTPGNDTTTPGRNDTAATALRAEHLLYGRGNGHLTMPLTPQDVARQIWGTDTPETLENLHNLLTEHSDRYRRDYQRAQEIHTARPPTARTRTTQTDIRDHAVAQGLRTETGQWWYERIHRP